MSEPMKGPTIGRRGFKVAVEAHGHGLVAHQFDTIEQQREADSLGMWLFLATEVMFFGALFTALAIYRFLYPVGFTEGSHHLNVPLGGVNTGVLLCSSLTVALAVHAAQHGHRRRLVILLLLTMVFGLAFLGIKAYEWYVDFEEGLVPGLNFTQTGEHAREIALFFTFYFTMTGLHALHMVIGIAVWTVITLMAWRGMFTSEKYMPVEITGLYWHFVDLVWVFLYPMLYLVG
jgi:cytochrome c oxidase subunit III